MSQNVCKWYGMSEQLKELKEEWRAAQKQVADQEKELLQLYDRNGDLGLEVHNLTEQLATVAGDREELAQLKQELRDKMADVHREGGAIELEAVRWQRERPRAMLKPI